MRRAGKAGPVTPYPYQTGATMLKKIHTLRISIYYYILLYVYISYNFYKLFSCQNAFVKERLSLRVKKLIDNISLFKSKITSR